MAAAGSRGGLPGSDADAFSPSTLPDGPYKILAFPSSEKEHTAKTKQTKRRRLWNLSPIDLNMAQQSGSGIAAPIGIMINGDIPDTVVTGRIKDKLRINQLV